MGLDLKTELDEGRMAVVDVFGSRYSPVHANIPGVFYLDKVEPETINPKIDIIYSQLREELGEDTKLFRLIYTGWGGLHNVWGGGENNKTPKPDDSREKCQMS
ncbi:hypothetical protein [Thermococcus peptonophilus]|uniref:hypothetical protein n=1 Tax=Thermococcus peptonophilus TaxID=53952 RepID=UPI0034678DEC